MSLTSTTSKALQAFEEGTGAHDFDRDTLVNNTFQTFSLLERWETAQSKSPAVQSIIQRVQAQGQLYFQTLDEVQSELQRSVAVAIRLKGLAEDAVRLSEYLLDPACKSKDINDFIADMQRCTRGALKHSKHISAAYRTVRRGIYEISDGIPEEMAKLEEKEYTAAVKKATTDRRVERTKVAKTVSTAALAVVSGVALFSLPPLILILPIALPIAILGLEIYENRCSKLSKERETETIDCQAALQELQDVTTCLARLADHVDWSIEAFLCSDTMLETISCCVDRLRRNNARLRLQAIMKQWKSVADFYTEYVNKLKRIQSFKRDAIASASSNSGNDSRQSRNHRSTNGENKLERRNAINQPNGRAARIRCMDP
ncbi:hypothetical protein R3P38DRAFT_2773388 [Favolaschia claudopus]|uniref:Uncharacterized protein n=1 Tax=Favolaschia claudopus TaxID=2862362 RepID=A0AAW0C0L2_9AGAR